MFLFIKLLKVFYCSCFLLIGSEFVLCTCLNQFRVVAVCFVAVRVKGGMSLRNGMWHELRNGIIMQTVIYVERLKK